MNWRDNFNPREWIDTYEALAQVAMTAKSREERISKGFEVLECLDVRYKYAQSVSRNFLLPYAINEVAVNPRIEKKVRVVAGLCYVSNRVEAVDISALNELVSKGKDQGYLPKVISAARKGRSQAVESYIVRCIEKGKKNPDDLYFIAGNSSTGGLLTRREDMMLAERAGMEYVKICIDTDDTFSLKFALRQHNTAFWRRELPPKVVQEMKKALGTYGKSSQSSITKEDRSKYSDALSKARSWMCEGGRNIRNKVQAFGRRPSS